MRINIVVVPNSTSFKLIVLKFLYKAIEEKNYYMYM